MLSVRGPRCNGQTAAMQPAPLDMNHDLCSRSDTLSAPPKYVKVAHNVLHVTREVELQELTLLNKPLIHTQTDTTPLAATPPLASARARC